MRKLESNVLDLTNIVAVGITASQTSDPTQIKSRRQIESCKHG